MRPSCKRADGPVRGGSRHLGLGLLFCAAFGAWADTGEVRPPPLTLAARLTNLPQSARTPLDARLCDTRMLTTAPVAAAPEAADPADAWLRKYSPLTGARLRRYLPGEFDWWTRQFTALGQPAAHALGGAIHESLHGASAALKLCDAGRWHYVLDGDILSLTPGEHGRMPYAQAADVIETGALRAGLRFRHYMANGGLASGNNLDVLLDELNAYIAESEFLLSVMEDPEQAAALVDTGVQTDAGLGGAMEFQLFTLAYLARQCRDPEAAVCRGLQRDAPLLAFVRSRFARIDAAIQRWERLPAPVRTVMSMPPGVEEERQREVWAPLKHRLGL